MQIPQPVCHFASVIRQPHSSRTAWLVSYLHRPKMRIKTNIHLSRSCLPSRPSDNLDTLPNRPLYPSDACLRQQHDAIEGGRVRTERRVKVRKVSRSANIVPSSPLGSAVRTQTTKADACRIRFLRAVHAVQPRLCAAIDWGHRRCHCDTWEARKSLLLSLRRVWVIVRC